MDEKWGEDPGILVDWDKFDQENPAPKGKINKKVLIANKRAKTRKANKKASIQRKMNK